MVRAGLILILGLLWMKANGQAWEFTQPERLGSYVNSDADEISPLLSPDGRNLYFVRALSSMNVGGKMGGTDIWSTRLSANGQWLPSQRESRTLNNRESNAVIGFRSNGNTIYLLNAYTSRGGIAFATRINNEWTAPEVVPIPGLEKSTFVGFYMDPRFTTLLISMKKEGEPGEEDLYVSIRDSVGVWSTPVNLGPSINTQGFEISPFLSADGTRLYFASNGHDGLGDADIYVSTRLYGSWTVWTKPKNMGSPINSEKFDAYYAPYGDTVAFFASNRASEFADIYQAKIVQKSRVNMKDSVDRLVRETRKLLAEMGNAGNPPADEEFIVFEGRAVELSPAVQDEVDILLRKYQIRGIRQVNVVGPLNSDANTNLRLTNLINYIVARGIQREIVQRKTSPEMTNGHVIRVEFLTKN